MSLFGIEIDQIVSDALDGQLKTATLTRDGEYPAGVEYDPIDDRYEDANGDPVSEPSDQEFTTEGIVESYSDKMISEGLVEQNDRKILLIAKKLGTTPKSGDKITIESETYTVVGVPERDPASATWIVQGRAG